MEERALHDLFYGPNPWLSAFSGLVMKVSDVSGRTGACPPLSGRYVAPRLLLVGAAWRLLLACVLACGGRG